MNFNKKVQAQLKIREQQGLSYNPTGINNPSQPYRRIGPYELREMLGKGGMAQVFKAYQPSLDRFVAIKLLSPSLANDTSFIERFKHEARAIARLRHPNIVAVHDFGEENGTYYLVMELIEGRTLKDEIARGPIPPGRLLEIVEQVGSALDTAHRNNILHRDIKPNNILLEGPRRAVLSDFGIAKELDRNTVLTQAGYGVGTPDYMSPEQALGQVLDTRSDQYSFAVVIYEMMVGRPPFKADTAVAVLAAHINQTPPPPRQFNPGISPTVEGIILRALSKDPRQRFNNVADMVRALKQEIKPVQNEEARTFVAGVSNAPRPPEAPAPTQAVPQSPQSPQAQTPTMVDARPPLPAGAPTVPPPPGYAQTRAATPVPPPPAYAQMGSAEQLFGYKGIPGAPPVPRGPLGELPPPLKMPGRGCLVALLVFMVLLLVGLGVGLALWRPWEQLNSTAALLNYYLGASPGYSLTGW
jgi:serine/threonine-protein kinase